MLNHSDLIDDGSSNHPPIKSIETSIHSIEKLSISKTSYKNGNPKLPFENLYNRVIATRHGPEYLRLQILHALPHLLHDHLYLPP